jgi:hypothetical protein
MIEEKETNYHKMKAEYYNECNEVIDMLKIISDLDDNVKMVQIICPICSSKRDFSISKTKLKPDKLTTVSLPSGLVCEHTFQAFIDKQFKIRGYQKVDLELSTTLNENNDNTSSQYNDSKDNSVKEIKISVVEDDNYKKDKHLEELYEKFREFIDDDNPTFRELIIKDNRRNK